MPKPEDPATGVRFRYQDRLYFLGILLFLIGLLTGLASGLFKNPRLGLAAHLEAVMNGMFLVLVGLIWDRVRLSQRMKVIAFYLLLWGAYVNWSACVLGGAFGASQMTPIAGAGFSATSLQEGVVAGMFVSVGLTMLVAVALLAFGLFGSRPR